MQELYFKVLLSYCYCGFTVSLMILDYLLMWSLLRLAPINHAFTTMNFYTIQFNIRINVYLASPTSYTYIVLSDMIEQDNIYKIHELHNDQSVERHKILIGFKTPIGFFVKALWY